MGFSSQESWSVLPFPAPGDLPNLETEHKFLTSCIGRQILYHCTTCEAPLTPLMVLFDKKKFFSVLLFFGYFLSWSIVDLQCVSFWYTVNWFSFINIYKFFVIFISIKVCCRILNIVSWAMQWDLVVYLFYKKYFVSANPKFLILSLPPFFFRFGNRKFDFHVCESVSIL